MKATSIVGDLINFRGLVYSPINENGVIFLFGKVAQDMNMYVEEIKPGFPDCIARRFNGKGWERVDIEFEFLSSSFKEHGHNAKECDLIICWEHDWPECPVEVIALKDVIPNLQNPKMTRPDGMGLEQSALSLDALVHKSTPAVADLYRQGTSHDHGPVARYLGQAQQQGPSDLLLAQARVRVPDDPEKGLSLTVFTRGKPVHGVAPFEYKSGEGAKWGRLAVRAEKDLEQAKCVFEASFSHIKQAIEANENTCWFAPMEEEALSLEDCTGK